MPITGGGTPQTVAGPAAFVAWLQGELGKPYKYGGTGPGSFDCSGLIYSGLQANGIRDVPRTSEGQWQWIKDSGNTLNKDQLQPGDLVFSQWPGDNASPGHVQVYVGNGQVIQAPHTGASVSTASLSSDTGHIVGYGRIPEFAGIDWTGALGFGTGVATGQSGSNPLQAGQDIGQLIKSAGSLLHGVSEVLDFAFSFFAPGQGWRIAFGAGAVVAGTAAVKAYTAPAGAEGGSNFPLAVGLGGVATLAAFMALRPWPQVAGGPEKPGAYAAEILSGQPPPPGPRRVKETSAIEAGLAVFAVAWLADKAAKGINSVISGISSALLALGLVAAA